MPIATSVASITGVAFNAAGKLFMTTGSNSGLGVGVSTAGTNYNILYRMTSITPLVIDSIANLPNSYGDDMTSCFYPAAVLGVSFNNFTATLQHDAAMLLWNVNEDPETTEYEIEFSTDAQHWQTIGHVPSDRSTTGLKTYNYTHGGITQGKNYYRIIELSATGKMIISETRLIDTKNLATIYIGPNPVHDVIYFYNKQTSSSLLAKVFDYNGRLVYSGVIAHDQQSLDINRLPKGQFILKLSSGSSGENVPGYQFIKW
jgi:hypothetical protein